MFSATRFASLAISASPLIPYVVDKVRTGRVENEPERAPPEVVAVSAVHRVSSVGIGALKLGAVAAFVAMKGLAFGGEGEETAKVLVIPGGTAGTAGHLAIEWLQRGSDREVLFLVRNKKDVYDIPELKGRVKWVLASKDEYGSSEKLFLLLSGVLQNKPISSINMVSCIGSAVPVGGQTLDQINVDPVVNVSEAIVKLAQERGVGKVSLVNISSITANAIHEKHCEYIESRRKADRGMKNVGRRAKLAHPEMHIKAVAFRPGIIKSGPHGIKEHHAWDLEQLVSSLPFMIVPGSGKQEIPIVSTEDLTHAIVNCIDLEKEMFETIQAVTQHRYTYNEIMEFFADLVERDLNKLHLPTELVKEITELVPHGKIAPYSGLLFHILDHKEAPNFSHTRFEEILNRPAQRLEDIFPRDYDYHFEDAPVLEHAKVALAIIRKNPEIGIKLVRLVLKHMPELIEEGLHLLKESTHPREKKEGRSEYALPSAITVEDVTNQP